MWAQISALPEVSIRELNLQEGIGAPDESTEIGRRGEGRLRLYLESHVALMAGTYRAMLCDLSATGAMIRTEAPLPVNAEAVVRWGPFEGFGRTMWSDGQLTGVRFYEPIDWDTVLATRRRQDERGLTAEAADRWISYFTWICGKALC